MNAVSTSAQYRRALFTGIVGLALALAITLPPLSSTRLQTWPLAMASSAFWLLPLVVALVRLFLDKPDSRFGGLVDLAFLALAVSGLCAVAASPLRATIAPQILPFLGAIALPYALLPIFRNRVETGFSVAFIIPLILVSSILWQLAPTDLASPHVRNDQPFGHANTTGSVFAIAACWLGCLAWRASNRSGLLALAGSALLCIVHVISSGSRGSLIALAGALAVCGGLVLLRRGRVITFLVTCALIAATALAANSRLREAVFAGSWSRADQGSNSERLSMIRGGLALFAERPFFGWGPGSVPHAFPSARAQLSGAPDNYLQLHNTPTQLAATLGTAGILSGGLLLFALFFRVRSPARPPLAATLSCAGLVLLFDHTLATPAFALLVALPVAALGSAPRRAPATADRARWWTLAPALGLAIALPSIYRDLAARAAWSDALDAASANEPGGYAVALNRARELAPADPFYVDQLASHLATGHPFPGLQGPNPAAAIPLLNATVERNPFHEFARYNLGWLLLASSPPEARDHFIAAARLAPARREVYLGLALAHILAADGVSPVPALAAEILLDPTFAWSPRWRDRPLAPYRAAALYRAADFVAEHGRVPAFAESLRSADNPVDAILAYRRVRTGHGVLYGHPDGPPPADTNILLRVQSPPGAQKAFPPAGALTPADLLSCAELAP